MHVTRCDKHFLLADRFVKSFRGISANDIKYSIYIYIYTYLFINTHKYVYIYIIYTHICTYIYIYAYMYNMLYKFIHHSGRFGKLVGGLEVMCRSKLSATMGGVC